LLSLLFFYLILENKKMNKVIMCPFCDSPMRKISGSRGDFYGCTQFRASGCKGTRKVEDVEFYEKGVEEIVEQVIEKENNLNVNNYSILENLFKGNSSKKEDTRKNIQKKEQSQIELIHSKNYPHIKYKFEYFNPVQSEVFKYYDKDINCVVAAETSAGKTVVAEMFMADSISKGKKAIFLSPLRAVSQEKYDDWTSKEHSFGNLNVSIVTGDYQLTNERVEELNNANIIILTTEMIDSRTRRNNIEQNKWLTETNTIVYDEIHSLQNSGRGDKIESSLMRFSKQNPNCRIVLLSATMSNVEELSNWTATLNNKKTELINSDYRPVKLNVHYEVYNDKGYYNFQESNKIKKAIQITQQFKQDKFIVFVHSKTTGRKILKILQDMGEKVLEHNADLPKEKRKEVSDSFKSKNGIRIIVATSTLAFGVNLPCRRCVIVGVHRGLNEVDPIDIKQEVGRCGRLGLDDIGDAHILLPESKFTRYKFWCQNIPPIKSTMNKIDTVAFHIISEISEGEVRDIKTLMDWYNRSLAAFQNDFLDSADAYSVLSSLVKSGALEKQDDIYKVTNLGKIASWLYYSPYTISSWYENFKYVFSKEKVDDLDISWALANINENNTGFVSKDIKSGLENIIKLYQERGLIISEKCAITGYLIFACLKNIEEVDLAKNKIKLDIERIISALKMIDSMQGNWDKNRFWSKLQLRIAYEISEEQTELCSLRGIGNIRVKKLFNVGIKTVEQFKKEKEKAIFAIGEETYNSALKEVSYAFF
jgi:helicase